MKGLLQETDQLLNKLENEKKLKLFKTLNRKARLKHIFNKIKKYFLILLLLSFLLYPKIYGEYVGYFITEFVTPIKNAIIKL